MKVDLYRCRTATDWLCPCGRVARELRKAGHEVVELRLPREGRDAVRALTGQTKVPVAVFDGDAICDSHRIVDHVRWLDDAAAQPAID